MGTHKPQVARQEASRIHKRAVRRNGGLYLEALGVALTSMSWRRQNSKRSLPAEDMRCTLKGPNAPTSMKWRKISSQTMRIPKKSSARTLYGLRFSRCVHGPFDALLAGARSVCQ
eukprot:3782316-Amphidinium_carterae.1